MDENNATPQNAPENAQPTPAEQAPTQQAAPEATAAQAAPAAAPAADAVAQAAPATEAPAPAAAAPATAAPAPVQAAPQPQAAAPSPTGALVCGILSLVLSFIPIVGIILGIVAIVLAGRYFKAGGTQGTGKAGRICGIIGIVLSVIVMIANIALVIMGLSLAANSDYLASQSTPSYSSASTANVTTDTEAADAGAAAEAQLELIASQDPATVNAVAAIMQETFDGAFATASAGEDIPTITLSSLGVDPTALAEAMMDGFTYEELYVNQDGDEAEATYSIETRDIYDVASSFASNVQDQLSEMMASGDASTASLEQFYQQMGESLMAAVTNEYPTSSTVSLDVESVGGTWKVDPDSWEDMLEDLYAFM